MSGATEIRYDLPAIIEGLLGDAGNFTEAPGSTDELRTPCPVLCISHHNINPCNSHAHPGADKVLLSPMIVFWPSIMRKNAWNNETCRLIHHSLSLLDAHQWCRCESCHVSHSKAVQTAPERPLRPEVTLVAPPPRQERIRKANGVP